MTPILLVTVTVAYFALVLLISHLTSKNATADTFFRANRNSPWYLVAFGMIGASLSGVTFISIPGQVGNNGFTYMQVTMGYLVGYFVIARVLLPLYYKLNVTSIYTYLNQRFGWQAYKTGAAYFLVSRVIGASARLYLVANVLQMAFFDAWDVPFYVTVAVSIILVWLYTYRGGIKTVVWTDTLQTAFMLLAAALTLFFVLNHLQLNPTEFAGQLKQHGYGNWFNFNWEHPDYFWKQFISGVFIAIVMTGLDQDMMQKNLTCRSLTEAQKNMYSFTFSLIFVNLLFLSLGGALYLYAIQNNIALPDATDNLYPLLALQHFPTIITVAFVLGIIAAAYSSADSALTALTTSFCIDLFPGFSNLKPNLQDKWRKRVHIGFSVLLFIVINVFALKNDKSVIYAVLKIAGYTYGPLLGLFAYGILTHRSINNNLVLPIALSAPILCYIADANAQQWLNGYQFGFEILLLNGLLTFTGLHFFSKKSLIK